MKIITKYIWLTILLLANSAGAALSLKVDGVDGAIKDNVNVYLSAIPEKDYSTSLRFQSRVRDSVSSALKALGYYQPDISFVVSDDESEIRVVIEKNAPVLVEELDVQIDGQAAEDTEFTALVSKSGMAVGVVLDHSKYDSLKTSIRNLALAKGYFDGEFTKTALEVAPDLNQAFIRLHYASGLRYQFGETTLTGSQIEEERVRSLIPYTEGQPYSASDVGVLNQRLSNTDWFSSVIVKPNIQNAENGQLLPIEIALAPNSKNQIETGLGYSTDVGVRGSLKWNKPWVNSYGHSFDSSMSLSVPEQSIIVGYKVPLEDVLNEYYRFQYGMKYEDNEDTESFEANTTVERHWQLSSGWHRNLFIKYLHEDFTQGSQDDDIAMIIPGVTYSRTQTSGGSMPRSGNKYSLTLEVSDESIVSRARMFRVQGRSSWIGSLGNNHRGLLKLGLSANLVENILDVPPSIRFFAGGDNSIRGYDYESISPKDDSGALIGAKYMATSSLEYQYRVQGNWWLATFVDAGDAWSETPEIHVGPGFGVRWASPVGPVRLDFAWGLANDTGDEFRVHFALGPEL